MEGQRVIIKFEGYPYREYGVVEGIISKLSITSGADSTFWGHIDLPNQLTTRQGNTLLYKNGLKGTAEMITADRRLIQRFLSAISRAGQ